MLEKRIARQRKTPRVLLFSKAIDRRDKNTQDMFSEQFSLFHAPSNVRGYTDKNGRTVAPHMALRAHKRDVATPATSIHNGSVGATPMPSGADSSASNGRRSMPDIPDFSSPKTFEESPELATMARRAAEKEWRDRLSGTISFGDYKREVLEGKHPEVVERLYREKSKAQAEKRKSVASGADAARAATLPDGYKLEQEGDGLIVSGKFDQDLHERIKRAGGEWSGVANGNRRVWIVPATKGASLAKIFANYVAKKSAEKEAADLAAAERAERERVERAAKEKELADARASAPEVKSGKYGPFTVIREVDGYRVSFPYNPDNVAAVKRAGGQKYNPTYKTWFIDRADSAKLLAILDAAVAKHAEISAAAAEPGRTAAPTQKRVLFPLSTMPKFGVPVMHRGSLVVFTGSGNSFSINEDHPSVFGSHLLGHEGERGAYAYYRSATDQEAARYAELKAQDDAAADRAHTRMAALESAKNEIISNGEAPAGINSPVGEVIADSQTIYGSGDWFVISRDYIWYVKNNGADGDNWSANNVATGGAGAIGWRVPYSIDLERRIKGV